MLNLETEAKTSAPEEITKTQKVVNIIAIILCVILIPILVMNCVLIVKGLISPNEVPSVFGKIPLIVLTESMDPEIKSGDLIICDEIDPSELKVDVDRAQAWIKTGAQPTETVRDLLKKAGAL